MKKEFVIGIDFGVSNFDFVLMKGKKVVKTKSYPSNLYITKKELEKLILRFTALKQIKQINVTGFASKKLGNKLQNVKIKKIDEIQAIGFGAKSVSKENNFLAVSLGSGTACVSVKGKKIKHVGGTAVGGKTLQGLAQILLGTNNLKKIEFLAKKGNLKKIDLILEEIYPKGIGLLPKNATASHFGNLTSFNKKDLALGLINLVAQVIGSISVFAMLSQKHNKIIFIGRLVSLNSFKKILLKRVFWLNKTKIIIPKNPGIATAIGAALYE